MLVHSTHAFFLAAALVLGTAVATLVAAEPAKPQQPKPTPPVESEASDEVEVEESVQPTTITIRGLPPEAPAKPVKKPSKSFKKKDAPKDPNAKPGPVSTPEEKPSPTKLILRIPGAEDVDAEEPKKVEPKTEAPAKESPKTAKTEPKVEPKTVANPEPKTLPKAEVKTVESKAPPKKLPLSDEPKTVEISDEAIPAKPQTVHVDLAVLTASLENDAKEPEAARLKDIQPGTSTVEDLARHWGQPTRTEDDNGIEHRWYALEKLKGVEASIKKDTVISITVELDHPFEPAQLAEELRLDSYEAVLVSDDSGELVGQVYPEKGVVFLYETGAREPTINRIMLEPIDSEPFILRAEANWPKDYSKALADLKQALKLSPDSHRAAALEARVLTLSGQAAKALQSLAKLIEKEPEDYKLRITKILALSETGDVLAATAEARKVIALEDAPDQVRASAMVHLGNLIANGPGRDHKRALEMHQGAIRLAEPLLADRNIEIRQQAHEVLLDAHLGVALDIAWGRWKSKDKTVPKWLEQSDALAKAANGNDWTKSDFEFRVAKGALSAYVGMQQPLPDERWAEIAEASAGRLLAATEDPIRKEQLHWALGSALHDALQIYLAMGKHDLATKYGAVAVEHLEKGGEAQKKTAGANYMMARCYFRVGSIYALQSNDHKQAATWFEKAVPLLEGQVPISALADVGRQGETLVSIGVSYWEVGKQQEALRVTARGLQLMEQAVEEEILPAVALSVPYSNLASMHRFLGQEDKAKEFERMASAKQDKIEK